MRRGLHTALLMLLLNSLSFFFSFRLAFAALCERINSSNLKTRGRMIKSAGEAPTSKVNYRAILWYVCMCVPPSRPPHFWLR